MSRTPLFDSLQKYSQISKGYFRIPGHRFERGIPKPFTDFAGGNIFKLDITETPLADDLHNPKSVIAESQRMTAEAFGAGGSFYLVNGTTCGNQAMIIAACAGAGAGSDKPVKILVPRNAHKSVMAGLIMSGAEPVYMPAEYISELGLTGPLAAAPAIDLINANPDAAGVFAVSPSYHGFCSDIAALADAAHRHEMPLLVDEAHGTHFYFSRELPEGALKQGADACAQSVHKTAGALTQASLLHYSADSRYISPEALDSALRMTMSTSPSYLLMSSLELARNALELGAAEGSHAIMLAEKIREAVNNSNGSFFFSPDTEYLKKAGITSSDPARLIINCKRSGMSGYALRTKLWDDYQIDAELADEQNVLFLISFANTDEDADYLISALKNIADSLPVNRAASPNKNPETLPLIPEMAMTPREAYFAGNEKINWNDMKGRIAAEPVIPYPPGIPVLYPGEVIDENIFEYLTRIKKENRHLHGPADQSLSTFKVCL